MKIAKRLVFFGLYVIGLLTSCSNYNQLKFIAADNGSNAESKEYIQLSHEQNLEFSNVWIPKRNFCDTVYYKDGHVEYFDVISVGVTAFNGFNCVTTREENVRIRDIARINYSTGKVIDFENPEKNKPHQICDKVYMKNGTEYELIVKKFGGKLIEVEKCHDLQSSIPRALDSKKVAHIEYHKSGGDEIEEIIVDPELERQQNDRFIKKADNAMVFAGLSYIPLLGAIFSSIAIALSNDVLRYNQLHSLHSATIARAKKAKKLARISLIIGFAILGGIALFIIIALLSA